MPARYSAGMIDRRHFVALAAIPLTGLGARTSQATGMSRVTAYAFTFKGLDGDDILLLSYAGHPLLVVNTASQCGYTPQYAGLQKLWTRYFRRAGAGRQKRDSCDRPGDVPRHLSDHRKGRREGQRCPCILQVGGGRPAARCAALEFSQVSRRTRRPIEGGVHVSG